MPIPAELMQIWYNPAIPSSGDNLMLLEWCQTCAVTTNMYKQQVIKLQGLQ